ncbi:MAG: hypothetical protein WCB27_12865 [Thermoguttaceae bacterium]|jgi:hypothetical protein
MAEKSTPKRRSSRQAMVEIVAEAEKAVAERKETEAKPEERIAANTVRDAVAAADALSSDGVVRSIGELKSTIARTLTQLSDRLEEEIGKYSQICRAIAAKESELKEIYEIQRSASTLLAFLETQQRKQEEMQREYQTEKEQLQHEIETTRAEWETEKQQREQEIKERDAAEQKRRQRELEEYKYTFAREQQLARDRSGDELAKAQKELTERQTQLEREWGQREKALAASEQELAELRARAAGFAHELQAAAEAAAAEATQRAEQQHKAAQELLRGALEGEKNVLATKIAALERTVQEQAEQLTRLEQQAAKAYAQVQEIAVRAIEGSASTKQLANLQHLFAEQVRKSSSPER